MNAVFFYAPVPNLRKEYYFGVLSATMPINRKFFGKTFLYTPEFAEIDEGLVDQVVRMSSRQRHYPHYMRVMSWMEYLKSSNF